MSWLSLLRGEAPPGPAPSPIGEAGGPRVVEGAAPGAGLFFSSGLGRSDLAVLDLGPSSAMSFGIYRTMARRIRFADLFSDWGEEGWAEALRTVPRDPSRAVDRILAWDTLDRLSPEGRHRLIRILSQVAAPDARLHMVIRGSREAAPGALRFQLAGTDRMVYELGEKGAGGGLGPPLLPAELHTLLLPFQVENAFTLRGDLREYVAVWRGGD